MSTCRNCKNVQLSKNHLNQGVCNKIVQVGLSSKYKEGRLTLASEQPAGFIDSNDDHTVALLVNVDNFGCNLFESKNNEKPKSNENKKVPTKDSVEPKTSGSAKDNSGSK